MSTRKNVSWRVIDAPQSDTINKWLDAQKNIQDSLTNIVLHMIERFGIRNITDYDIQKMLYQEASMPVKKLPAEDAPAHSTYGNGLVVKACQQDVKQIVNKQANPEDDMYNDLDINNL